MSITNLSIGELIAKINNGEAFLNKVFADVGMLTIDSTIEVPAGIEMHFVFSLSGTRATEFYMYEAPTFTGGGVATIPNYKFSSTKTLATVLKSGVAVTNVGTLKFSGKVDDSATAIEGKVILKSDTSYLTRTVSLLPVNTINLNVSVWEETL